MLNRKAPNHSFSFQNLSPFSNNLPFLFSLLLSLDPSSLLIYTLLSFINPYSPNLFLETHSSFPSLAVLSLSPSISASSFPLSLSLLSCVVVVVFPPLQNLPQVKQVQALRQVKERLQAENRALARVLAKLSQSACSQLPTVDL